MLVHTHQPPTLHQCSYWVPVASAPGEQVSAVTLQILRQQFTLYSVLWWVQRAIDFQFVQLSLVVRTGVTTYKLLACLRWNQKSFWRYFFPFLEYFKNCAQLKSFRQKSFWSSSSQEALPKDEISHSTLETRVSIYIQHRPQCLGTPTVTDPDGILLAI